MTKQLISLQDKAIDEALNNNWDNACNLNLEILKLDKNNTDALLRLGFAYLQTDNLSSAKKTYSKLLKIMPANLIAKNNLARIKILEKKSGTPRVMRKKSTLDPNLFLNVFGKTKVITLINIGQAEVLAELEIGHEVFLKIKKRHVEIRTFEGDYIGAIPDDISKRLIYFIEAKSEYSAYIKEASRNSVDIFIKEEKLGRKVRKYISFPKNIQDNLKLMNENNEEKNNDESDTEIDDDLGNHENPIDIEQLAHELDENETYPEERSSEEESEDE